MTLDARFRCGIPERSLLRPFAVILTLVLGLGWAAAQPADAETIKCRREIARQSSKFVQAKIKALTRCEDQVLTGKIAGPCPDAKASAAIAKTALKLRSAIDQKCGGGDRSCGTGGDDDTLASLGFGGSCPNIASGSCSGGLSNCDDVSDCVSCIDQSAIDQAIDLATAPPAATAEALACQREIAKSLAKVVRAEAKAHGKCIDRVLKGGAGSCPDTTALANVARARAKFVTKACQRCGGPDRLCGGGNDVAPSAIGFGSSCPAVTVPGGNTCGGSITDMGRAIECVACVTEFQSACTAAAAAPAATTYPAQCNGSGPAPTVTATPAPGATATATPGGGATATPTPGGGGATATTTPAAPTATATPAPGCGNDTLDAGEDCDGSDAAACPGQCTPLCECPEACDLPSTLPEIVSFVSRPGSELDTGWTGVAHDTSTLDDALVTVARIDNCDTNPSSPTCGECQLTGPVSFPGPAKNCVCFNVGAPDGSSLATCDPEAPSGCGNPETCECFLGPPLPISSGGVPVCVVNRLTGDVTGTANIADNGPHAGEGAVTIALNSGVFNGLAVQQPCPICDDDTTPRDGVKNGTCSGGARNGQSCDVGGTSVFFGDHSMDCLPASATSIGTLSIAFDPATTGTSTLTKNRPCTNGNGGSCFCDTCADIGAAPCNSNADCASGVVCGGRRCIGGSNAGATCSVASQCPSGFCNRPGQPTAANGCIDSVCSPNPADGPEEGICEAGPIDKNCSIETYRGCINDEDCNPAPSGNCPSCASGQVCGANLRQCFLDTIVRTGTPGTQTAVVAATFCIPPTASQSVNQVAGLPGPGALELPTRIFRSGAQCGNGVLNAGEQCDGSADAACPGQCQPDCTCAGCGNGVVDAGEQCDGGDDAACPGACLGSCQCPAATCGNNVKEAGEVCDGADAPTCPGACQGDCTCGAVCGNDLVEGSEECDGGGSTACPASACQGDCTCGSFCGDGTIDAGEQCDGTNLGTCPGTCQGDCQCSPICGDDVRQAAELCDGTDSALCPGQCTDGCTCPGQGNLSFVVRPGADLDTGWTGTAHDSAVQTGSTIAGELSGCNGSSDVLCDFFGNVGSFCSADPSRSCTSNTECSGAGNCVIQTFGPPLPLSAGGVPACIINRFATDATGTYNMQTGDAAINLRLSSLVHLGSNVSAPCPICDCGKPNLADCIPGDSGTCTGIIGSPACRVGGNGPLGPTSNDCPPSSSLNVSGGGLDIPFVPATTGTRTFPTNQTCDGAGATSQQCWCDGQSQTSSCQRACDGGGNDGQACTSDGECPGAPAGACKPLCRQIVGEGVGEGECVAGPISQTCGGAPEVGCQNDSDCPAGKGPCVSKNQRCFMDPIVKTGTPGTATDVLVAAFCIPATSGQAINQTAGLPGPGALALPTTVTAALCGDGVKNRTVEECDGSDDDNCPGACLGNCTCNTACGNGVIEFGEQCDGSNAAACPNQCALPGTPAECTCPPVCGDGFLGAGEQCDPGGVGGTPPANDTACPGLCNGTNCQCTVQVPQCGNSTLDPGEVCDLPAAGCGPLQTCLLCQQCFPPPDVIPPELGFICGNGNIEPTEVCELPARGCGDGEICNPGTCDACVPALPGPVCGNLNIETGEVCELPSIGCGDGELCLLCGQCIPFFPICGNLNLEPGELCELPAINCGPLQVCLACTGCVP